MHDHSMKLMTDFRDKYLQDMKGCSILDIGAMQVIRQYHSYREIFEPEYTYIGMDIVRGRNVGIVGYKNITEEYDVVISGQVMEHVNRPWEWIKSLRPYFKKYICIIAPNTIKEHRYPIDTYRYFPDGMRDLFNYAGIEVVKIFKSDKDTVGIGTKIDEGQITLPSLLKKYYGVKKFLSSPILVDDFSRTDIAKTINRLEFSKGAEVGVQNGRYSKVLCQHITSCELLCIDSWSGENSAKEYKVAKEGLKSYNATLIKKTSMEAVKSIPENSLDFVYIDSNHSLVEEDLTEWSRRVKPGGIIAGHDYHLQSVKNAVDKYTKEHNIKEWFLTGAERWRSFFWIKI